MERSSASPVAESNDTKTDTRKRKRGSKVQVSAKEVAKRPKTKQEKNGEEDGLNLELGINTTFSHMNNQLVADLLAQKTRKYQNDLSSIELGDKNIPATSIQDTTSWDRDRTLDNFPGFLEKFAGNSTKLWSASKKNGAPHTIVVTAAGLRAAEIARVLRKFQTKEATVAKLFAKHIKINDSIKFLKSTRTGIAVGTPTRLKDIMDRGALVVDRLERIVVDASHIDVKKRGILDMKESQIPLMDWLGQADFKDRYAIETQGVRLLFY
ncbi:U3-containing 90S pre-ribosomal complex subunit-domain containing protein [Amylocarpus encephaloides]|uniref:U3-containing 90S pre-ribosomal complex subunit-domain containing protein n=1 Tax=Amylocarpus encephaloides TaxID=45428 RepID=A0A9P8C348_9HELO|nr:U3-containing 90S pre-ribosomal complex subunit-domain containing protein [Amylocarpus encephaloides]